MITTFIFIIILVGFGVFGTTEIVRIICNHFDRKNKINAGIDPDKIQRVSDD